MLGAFMRLTTMDKRFLPGGDVKRQPAGICFFFLRGRIISIFAAPQGRLIAPIHVKFRMTERLIGPLDRAKFHLNRWTGIGRRPP